MNTGATLFLVLSWGIILSLNVYCFAKILRKKKSP